MKHLLYIVPLLALLFVTGCKSEKKVTTYSDLYKERPVSILIAPIQDNAKRMNAKTSQDEVVNEELSEAANFMRQTLSIPLVSQGYYAPAPLAADILLQKEGKNYVQLMNGDISVFNTKYGMDAVLLTAIHKWQQPEVNEVVVYAEYTLRSTKSGIELMHTWVRGNKIQPVDIKGEPIELTTDNDFMAKNGMDSRLAYKCILLQQMSDFVLRNIPTSVSSWQFQHDRYIPSNPVFYTFTINPDGSIERSNYSEDDFGNECFTD